MENYTASQTRSTWTLSSDNFRLVLRACQCVLASATFATTCVSFRRVSVDGEDTITLGGSESTFLLLMLFSATIYCIWYIGAQVFHWPMMHTLRAGILLDLVFASLLVLSGIMFSMSSYNQNCDYFQEFLRCNTMRMASILTFILSGTFILSCVGFIVRYRRKMDHTNEKSGVQGGEAICIPYEEHITPAMGMGKTQSIATPTNDKLRGNEYIETRV
uniref:AlNc14C457G11774 protein n=1 Tax=Albugo laibachii Nc14 TaxID=890382 RepID=F0X035_9STRA|nr:AlNc14C457G11774 [Albugo laibachii Nc14]|eukprot:CCA27117.1 AlNc14C457G11774 [Albugo laibachii Nc14]